MCDGSRPSWNKSLSSMIMLAVIKPAGGEFGRGRSRSCKLVPPQALTSHMARIVLAKVDLLDPLSAHHGAGSAGDSVYGFMLVLARFPLA
mmetsp:Transcript_16122/g.27868  ORF Transcript_16122/g.27868 Transcript_16122/m.27868 type:complete len:90 (+) Transcript_16122:145-414(+)